MTTPKYVQDAADKYRMKFCFSDPLITEANFLAGAALVLARVKDTERRDVLWAIDTRQGRQDVRREVLRDE